MNSRKKPVQKPRQTTLKLAGSTAISLVAAALYGSPGAAQTTLPSSIFYFQTSGPQRCANIGDWYTTNGAVEPGCTTPTNNPLANRVHKILFDVSAEELAANGGSIQIIVEDAESTVADLITNPNGLGENPPDEVNPNPNTGGTPVPDPTRFELFQLTTQAELVAGSPGVGVPPIQTFTLNPNDPLSPATHPTRLTFTIAQPGTYVLTSVTGAGPILGDTTPELNDDDNSFRIVTNVTANIIAGQFQSTFQHGNRGVTLTRADLNAFFLVGPPKPDETPSLILRNFDLDSNLDPTITVTYITPSGGTVVGSVSGDAVWTGGGLNPTTTDTVPIGNIAQNTGAWGITVTNTPRANQFLIEANTFDTTGGLPGTRLPITNNPPTTAGNFVITPDTNLVTQIGVPVDHNFTVTNNFYTNDIVNLTLTGTNPNYQVQLIDPATNLPLPDTDGDGVPDTGVLSPFETKALILRATPQAGATTSDTTLITGTSFMDRQVRTQAGNPTPPTALSVTKITNISGFTLTDPTTLNTVVGQSVLHPFTVTNTSTTQPDTINLTTTGTATGYTVEFVDANGNPVPDTNGDGIPDTGSLPPGQAIQLFLRVTPTDPTAPVRDITTIQGTSVTTGAQQTVEKTTQIPNFTLTPDTDLQTSINVPADHPFVVTNTGSTNDLIDFGLTGTNPNYQVTILTETGQPLPDTDGDGQPDTGTLAPNASQNLILRVTPQAGATTPDTTVITGTSQTTTVAQQVTKVTRIGGFVLTDDTTLNTQIGQPVDHPITIRNTSATESDTINLQALGTAPGYQVQFVTATGQVVPDTNGDGIPDTGVLAPGQEVQLFLRVTPIDPNAPVQDVTTVQGTSVASGEQQTVTKTTQIPNFTLSQDGQAETPIGTPVNQPFTVTNTGATPDVIDFDLTGTDPNFQVLIVDENGQPLPDTNGDGRPDTGSLPPQGSRNLFLRVTPLAGATTPDATLITGTSATTGVQSQITKITNLPQTPGNITLVKRITRVFRAATGTVETYNAIVPPPNIAGFTGVITPQPAELQSGDLVEYTVYYINQSSGNVLNLEICDPIPNGTSFVTNPTSVPGFQGLYQPGSGIAFDVPSTLPLGTGVAISNVFDGDPGEFVSPLAPRASCPNENAGNQGAVVVRVGTVNPDQAGFVKFVTEVE